MTLSLRAPAEAIKLTRLWQAIHGHAYPIRAGELAMEWSRQVAPSEPVGVVEPSDLDGFEGGLFWLKKRSEWALLYKPHADCPGRTNFTIAHEFGHYVLHRKRRDQFNCTQDDTLGQGAPLEREADEFASYLLMPINDYRQQIGSHDVTLDVLGACAQRYAVSLTAATLKWLSFTPQAAILVAAREGMVSWWRTSAPARKLAFSHFRSGMELPSDSIVMTSSGATLAPLKLRLGTVHQPGVWLPSAAVREMAIVSDRYDMALSLLTFDLPELECDETPMDDLTTLPPTFGV